MRTVNKRMIKTSVEASKHLELNDDSQWIFSSRMETFLFIARFIIFTSVICLPTSEKIDKVQNDASSIKYNLIADETDEPNKFHIS